MDSCIAAKSLEREFEPCLSTRSHGALHQQLLVGRHARNIVLAATVLPAHHVLQADHVLRHRPSNLSSSSGPFWKHMEGVTPGYVTVTPLLLAG